MPDAATGARDLTCDLRNRADLSPIEPVESGSISGLGDQVLRLKYMQKAVFPFSQRHLRF